MLYLEQGFLGSRFLVGFLCLYNFEDMLNIVEEVKVIRTLILAIKPQQLGTSNAPLADAYQKNNSSAVLPYYVYLNIFAGENFVIPLI